MKMLLTVVALALPAWACADPQPVWRCGADGRSYSATPCADGRAIDVATADRPAADRLAAQQAAARERGLADTLRRERLLAEAAARGSGLAGFGTTPAAPPAVTPKAKKKAKSKPPADADIWRAIAPATRRARG